MSFRISKGISNHKRLSVGIVMFALILGLSFSFLMAKDAATSFADGEKYYGDKSFKKAMESFQEALKDAKFTKRNRAYFRIAECQQQLKLYLDAIKTFDMLIKANPNKPLTVDVMRAYATMRIHMPRYYYKKGDKISWGSWISGGSYHWLRDSNLSTAKKMFIAARELQSRLLLDSNTSLTFETRILWREKLASLHFEEASIEQLLEGSTYKWVNRSFWERANPEDPAGPKEVSNSRKKPKGEAWKKVDNRTFITYPKQDTIIGCYKQAQTRYDALVHDYEEMYKAACRKKIEDEAKLKLLETRLAGFMERAGESKYRIASYLSKGYNSSPETLRIVYGDAGWQKYYPLPLIDEFVEAYPEHYRAPEAMFLKASQQSNYQRFVEAVVTLKKLQATYKESNWTKTALTMQQEIERPRLSVNSSLNGLPGVEVKLGVQIRNMKNLDVEIYKFDLAKFLLESDYLGSYKKRLNSMHSLLNLVTDKDKYEKQTRTQPMVKDMKGLKAYLTKIATKSHKTKDISKHRYYSEAIATGVSEKGTYLVRVAGEKMFGANFIHIASKTLVSRPFSDRRLYFVADRKTGAPILGKNELVIKEYRWKPYVNYVKVFKSNLHEEESNYWHIYRELPPSHEIQSITAIARCEDGEIVFHTGERGRWWWSMAFKDSEIKGYTITDRPIYRPKQKINFTSILRKRKAGSYGFAPPEKGRKITVTMYDSKGSKLINQDYEVDEFGQIHGEYTLGDEPALGSYRIYMRWSSGSYIRFNSASHYFRVEEYRKPEYAVKVTTDQARMKVGSEVVAKVQGKYYFGAPVANGQVKYSVYRKHYVHTYRFPGAFDWLYGYVRMWHHSFSDHHNLRAGWGRELVTQGKGRLDDSGNFEIKFDAGPRTLAKGPNDEAVKQLLVDDPDLKRFFEKDFAYDVSVEVTDSSRRVINGFGTIKVTRQSFSLFSHYRNNFYRPKSKVEIELRAITPTGKAIATEGKLLIQELKRYWWANPAGQRVIKEDVIHDVATLPFAVDARGVVFIRRIFEKAGLYRLTFTAPDPEGGEIKHVNKIMIAGEDSTGAGLRFNTLEIVPEKRFYVEGEKISFAILTSDPGMTVHTLIEPGDGGVMPDKYAMRTLKGTTTIVNFEAEKDFVPNVFLTATSVRENRVHSSHVEVFVPPIKEFLNVSIKPNKTSYSPGEEGTIEITATDSEGKPVKAQFALSVADEAIFAIEPDRIPDIKKHFYGRRRYLSYRIEHSQNQYFYGAIEDTNAFGSRFWWGNPENGRNYSNGWFDRDYLTAKELEEIRTGKSTQNKLTKKIQEKYRSRHGNRLRGGLNFAGDMDRPQREGKGNSWGDPQNAPSPSSRDAKPMERLRKSKSENKSSSKDLGLTGKMSEIKEKPKKVAAAKERTSFKDTAFYQGNVRTDATGKAIVKFKYPDNLTTWRITARGATSDSKVGQAKTTTLVTKNIIIRIITPRFFMERDELVVSTIVHNKFDTPQEVQVILDLPTILSEKADLPASVEARFQLTKTVTVPAKGEIRNDWPVKVHADGRIKISASALSEKESDMKTMYFDAYRHGIEKFQTYAGAMSKNDETHMVNLELPTDFDPAKTMVRVGMTPTVATACIDAIPYLINYPYGCIEQTMSRFMPAVVVKGTLKDMGVSLEDVQKRRALVSTDKWDRGSINLFHNNPVFDKTTLDNVINAGLARIGSWQNGDGGWGWFRGFSSDPYMSAYVVHGLTLAKNNGIKIDESMLSRALTFLGKHFLIERNIHRAAFMAYALAPYYDSKSFGEREQYKRYVAKLMEKRADFNQLSRAYFALALHHGGREKDAKLLIENIEDYAKTDEQAGTAYWKTSSDGWWYWWNNALETNTAVLRALAAIKPNHKYIEPLSRWVINHRQGNKWESTKGSAFAILALMDYAKQRGELEADYTIEIYNGKILMEKIHITKENLLTIKPATYLYGDDVVEGKGKIRIVKKGAGSFAYTATLKTYDMSCPIKKAGYEIFIDRKYYKMTEKIINPEATDGSRRLTWEKTLLKDLDVVKSGDLIEVVLEIDSKNDYEYVLFNDMKPAGCEAVSTRSGYTWADGLGVFMEFRDERVSMFASWVPQGKHTLSYRLKAEQPGKFHALPTVSQAMYAPLVRANSDEMRINIKD